MALSTRRDAAWRVLASVVCIAALGASFCDAAPVGWRTDGTGKYPNATPPAEWGPDTGIVWKTPLPTEANGTPVPVDGKLLVTAEPMTVGLFDTSTGEILWARSTSFEEMATPEEAELMKAKAAEATEWRKQRGRLWGQMNKANKALQDDPNNEELKKQKADLEATKNDLEAKLAQYAKLWYSMPDAHPTNGYASATPVTDGEHVWVAYGTGVVACYDLEGNMKWRRMLDKPHMEWGAASSPILAGDKLIMHIHHLFALNKDTGETIWSPELDWSWGTPVVMNLDGTEVVVTAAGAVVRLSDGVVLHNKLARMEFGGIIAEGNVVYFIDATARAFRLGIAADGSLQVEKLWEMSPGKPRYYGSPVIHDGLIYAVNQVGAFTVIDAATGEATYTGSLDLGKGTCYPSIAFAGGNLYVSMDNGTTAVLKPGRQPQEIGRFELEPFRSSPVFVGDRLYIRGLKNLYCIGPAAAQ